MEPPPSLKYSRDCLVARSESTLGDKRRVWSLSVVTGGVANTLEICSLASYSKLPDIPAGVRQPDLFEIPCRHPLDYMRLSSASFPRRDPVRVVVGLKISFSRRSDGIPDDSA